MNVPAPDLSKPEAAYSRGLDPMTALLLDTWRALLAPKRFLPLLVVSVPLVAAQLGYTPTVRALAVAVTMIVAFAGLAPFSWRALFPAETAVSRPALRLVAFAAFGVATVLATGMGLPWLLELDPTFMTANSSWPILLAMFWVGGWGLGRDIDLERGFLRERRRAEALGREAELARLLALRSHFDPHFLFNTLNAIAEWTRTDGEIAEQAVLRLSAMLRSILEGSKASAWPLRHELSLVEDLFELYRARDPEVFRYELLGGDAAVDASVPPLLLLPLAENAMKHGPGAGHRGTVRLEVRRLGERRLRIVLDNPGPYTGRREGGEGIALVERRLQITYGRAGQLTLASHGDGTRAVLELPAWGPDVSGFEAA